MSWWEIVGIAYYLAIPWILILAINRINRAYWNNPNECRESTTTPPAA